MKLLLATALILFPCVSVGKSVTHNLTETQCLSLAIYKEARGEKQKGQVSVANVVLNRAKASGKSICSVVFAKGQFSWSRNWKPSKLTKKQEVGRFSNLAKHILENRKNLRSEEFAATHFHARKMKRKPSWTKDMIVVAVSGNHIFYKQKES